MEPQSKPLVLVVDDNETIRNLVSTILGTFNMEVACVTDGDEALAYLETRRPDVMLLDLTMQRVDGIEVLRRVRAHPTLHDLVIVMLTAVASTARYDEVQSYNPAGFLEKPFRVNDLVGAIEKALKRPAA